MNKLNLNKGEAVQVTFYKVWFRLIDGEYEIKFADQKSIDKYEGLGWIVLKKKIHSVMGLNKEGKAL